MWQAWKNLLKALQSNEVRQITISEPWWYPGMAVITGILAAISGIIYVRTATLGNDAVYYSNQAVLAQTQASDFWAEYESDSGKAKTVEIGLLLASSVKVKAELQKQYDDYRKRQPPLKDKAKEYESIRDQQLKMTDKKMHDRSGLNIAGMIIQLGIGLASISALTKRHIMFLMTIAVSIAGIGATGFIFLRL